MSNKLEFKVTGKFSKYLLENDLISSFYLIVLETESNQILSIPLTAYRF